MTSARIWYSFRRRVGHYDFGLLEQFRVAAQANLLGRGEELNHRRTELVMLIVVAHVERAAAGGEALGRFGFAFGGELEDPLAIGLG